VQRGVVPSDHGDQAVNMGGQAWSFSESAPVGASTAARGFTSVQRAAEPAAAGPAMPEPAGGSGAQAGAAAPAAAGGGGPAAGGSGGGHDEKEIHELAEQLYPVLTSMLRREVLTERERAGFVTDLR